MSVIALRKAPQPMLSEARQRLHDHCVGLANLQKQVSEHQDRQRAKDSAEIAYREATDALDEVDAIERARWRTFIEGGAVGPTPMALTELRTDRATTLAQARARVDIARSRAAAIEGPATEAQGLINGFLERRAQLIADVLLEEARMVAEEYRDTVRAAQFCEAKLGALRASAYQLDAGGIAESISRLLRLGPGPNEYPGQRLTTKQEFVAIQNEVAALTDRLCDDPAATLKE